MGVPQDGKINEIEGGREGASSDAIRSEIEQTLSRMDDTLDELGTRLRPGQLIGGVFSFFRGERSPVEEEIASEREGAAVSAGNAGGAAEKRPVNWRRLIGPSALLIAGVAWMVFEEERKTSRPAVRRSPPRRRREMMIEEEFDRGLGIWKPVARSSEVPETASHYGSEDAEGETNIRPHRRTKRR